MTIKKTSSAPAIWRFFFDDTAPDTLCVLRMIFGAFLVAELLLLTPVVLLYMPDGGPIPFDVVRGEIGSNTLTLLTLVRSPLGILALHVLGIVAAVGITVGLWTGLSTLIAYVVYLSFMNGALYVWDGGDGVISIVLFLLTLAGLAGHTRVAYSLDAWIARRRKKPLRTAIPAWPVRMLQLQLCLLYFFSSWYKTQFVEWQTGEALHFVFNQLAFSTFPMAWISNFPILLTLLTYVVLFLETSFPFLVWVRPLKTPLLWAMFLFHLLIRLSMHVFAFTVMLPLLIVFVEPLTVRKWMKRWMARWSNG